MSRNRRIEFFEDSRGKWRWREVAPNGNITAEGGQGYASKYDAVKAFRSHVKAIQRGRFVTP